MLDLMITPRNQGLDRACERIEIMRAAVGGSLPYLENRLRIRPAGVVSKKLIGDLNMAKAIRSCNFRDA
jgi:hypothetical protein